MFKYLALALAVTTLSVQASTITLNFTNMNLEKGQLAVAVFSDPNAFPDQASHAISTSFFPLAGGVTQTSVTLNLKPGHYALSTFLDTNKNQKLDKNFVGIPKERFGFSLNPKVTVSAPNFSECAFEVIEGKAQVLTIRLMKFL